MLKFFNSFLKNPKRNGAGKKILVFVLLFSVIFIITPQIVFAGCGTGAVTGVLAGAGTTWWTGLGLLITVPVGAIIGCAGGYFASSALDKTIKWTAGGVMVAVGSILMSLISGAIAIAQALLDLTINEKNFFSYTGFDNPVIATGWTQVRDLANMFIILGILIIAIATILRFKEYEAKKLLPKLIIAALLINFSLLICGIFIDGSNIATTHFLKSGGRARGDMITMTGDTVKAMSKTLWEAPDVSTVFAQVTGIVINGVITFFILILFAFLFLFRHIALWILVMLSPLAFVFYVFPFTKKYFDMWWSNFLGWCIIGIPGAFFLYLADQITVKLDNDPKGFLTFYIPGFLLIIGFLVSLQTSAMGSGFIISAAKSLTGKAKAMGWAGAKGAGGALANATGASRAATWTKEKGKAAAEWAGFIPKGSTEAGKRKDLEKIRGSMEAGYGDNAEGNTKLAEIATQRGNTLKQRREKAAAAEILAKRKAFNYIPAEKREAVAAHAVAFGVSKETFTKESPELLTKTSDAEATQRLREREHIRLVDKEGKTEAEAAKLAKGYSPNQLAIDKEKADIAKEKTKQQKIGYIVPTEKDIQERAAQDYTPSATEITYQKSLMPAGATDDDAVKELKKKFAPNVGELAKARQNLTTQRMQEKVFGYGSATADQARKQLISDRIDELRKLFPDEDPKTIDSRAQTYAKGLTESNIGDGMSKLNKERKAKEIKKLSVPKMRELPAEMFDADLVEQSNYGTFNRAYLEFTTEQKEKQKTLLPELENRVRSVLGLSDKAGEDEITFMLDQLEKSKDKEDKETYKQARDLINKAQVINS